MKNVNLKKWITFGVVVIAVIAGGIFISHRSHPSEHDNNAAKDLYYCPMHPSYTANRPGTCPICNMNLVKAEKEMPKSEAHQHDSELKEFTVDELVAMKPGEICLLHKCKMGKCMIALTPEMARQGKCPHCGEDLGIIVKEVMPEGYAPVSLSSEKQQLIGVTTAVVRKKNLTQAIRTVGTVAKDAELYQAEAEYIQAFQSLKKAKTGGLEEVIQQATRLVNSSRIRLTSMGLSESLIEEIAARTEPDQSLLYAQAGQPVWVYAQIYEYELPLVKVDQEVSVDMGSLPGVHFQGVIRAIDPVVDPATRTTRIRIKLKEANAALRPDMYVNIHIQIELGEVLAIPAEAVFDTGNRKIVFVEKGNGNYEPREVVVGSKTENVYEVKQGIDENEKVVVSGNFLIDSESRLRASLSSSASNGGHQHGA